MKVSWTGEVCHLCQAGLASLDADIGGRSLDMVGDTVVVAFLSVLIHCACMLMQGKRPLPNPM